MVVLVTVFSNLFQTNIQNYPVYVLIGNIVFNFNADASTQGMNSIVANSSLIKKVYIPKYLFPLSNVVSCLVNFGFSVISLVIVMLITQAPFHLTMITLWIPLCYLFMFTFGLGLTLCAVNVYFRDTQHLYSVVITAWMYLTPLFYTVDIVPPALRNIMHFNPMYQYVFFFRQIILDGTFPCPHTNLICFSIGTVTMIFGLFVFAKLQDRFILHI